MFKKILLLAFFLFSFQLQAAQLVAKVEGMTCSGCAEMLQAHLAKKPGVAEVTVSFKTKTLKMATNGNGPSDEELRSWVGEQGKKVSGITRE